MKFQNRKGPTLLIPDHRSPLYGGKVEVQSIIEGRGGLVVEDICRNANVILSGWALYDSEGLPIYSKFKLHEDEFGVLAIYVLDIYKRLPKLTGSCYYLQEMNIFLYRFVFDKKYYVLTIAIEKNIRNHGLVALQLIQYEKRVIEILRQM